MSFDPQERIRRREQAKKKKMILLFVLLFIAGVGVSVYYVQQYGTPWNPKKPPPKKTDETKAEPGASAGATEKAPEPTQAAAAPNLTSGGVPQALSAPAATGNQAIPPPPVLPGMTPAPAPAAAPAAPAPTAPAAPAPAAPAVPAAPALPGVPAAPAPAPAPAAPAIPALPTLPVLPGAPAPAAGKPVVPAPAAPALPAVPAIPTPGAPAPAAPAADQAPAAEGDTATTEEWEVKRLSVAKEDRMFLKKGVIKAEPGNAFLIVQLDVKCLKLKTMSIKGVTKQASIIDLAKCYVNDETQGVYKCTGYGPTPETVEMNVPKLVFEEGKTQRADFFVFQINPNATGFRLNIPGVPPLSLPIAAEKK